MITVDVHGLDELQASLADLPPQLYTALGTVTRRAAEDILRGLQAYPAAPPSSTYKRTGTLGGDWHIEVDETDARVLHSGRSEVYEPYVQDRESQTATHKNTGWATWQDVSERRLATVDEELEQEVQRLVEKTP